MSPSRCLSALALAGMLAPAALLAQDAPKDAPKAPPAEKVEAKKDQPKVIRAVPVLTPEVARKLAEIREEQRAKEKEQAKKDIYDTKADAKDLVAKALAKAKAENRRVLVMFGGNWCGWCHKLHATLGSDRDLSRTMLYEYQLVMIDTEAPNARALLDDWKVKLNGVPYLVVLDADGKVLTRQETGSLEEGDHHDPKKVAAFLGKWVAPPLDAAKVLDAAIAKATSEDKKVFLHFGAPWCGWCHRLEDFLARPDVAPVLGMDFVDLKIDVDRMTGGKDLLAKFKAEQKGIPWFAFLDRDGKVVVDSDGPKGNVGYPAAPEEIDHFVSMLKKACVKVTPAQVATIEKELRKAGEAIRGNR